MASDHDPLITLTEARAFIAREYGREISRATLKRWAKRGVRGRRLDHRILGDWYYTRRSWVRLFLDGPIPAELDSADRRFDPEDLRRTDQATADLQREGFLRAYSKEKVPSVR